jgi:hypothetical protein
MSLLRAINSDFLQATRQLQADLIQAGSIQTPSVLTEDLLTGSWGVGVLEVPVSTPAGSTVAVLPTTTAVVSLSANNYNLQFNAAELTVGRVIYGINKGAGVITFTALVPGSITFIDNNGDQVTGAVGLKGATVSFVVTQSDGTNATLQSTGGSYGGSPIQEIGASATTATFGLSTTTVVSRATGALSLEFFPPYLGLGRRIVITQTGAGTCSLTNASGTTVTFLDAATGSSYNPSLNQGESSTFVVMEYTATTATLQELFSV